MLSQNQIEMAANGFFKQASSQRLTGKEEVGAYELTQSFVRVNVFESFTQPITMSYGQFIGGVAFALIEQRRLSPAVATPTDVADVCFRLGQKLAWSQARRSRSG